MEINSRQVTIPHPQALFCSTKTNIINLKYSVIMYRKKTTNVCKTKDSRLYDEILNNLYTSFL